MKNTIILASLAITGAAIVTYFVRRRKGNVNIPVPIKHTTSHHLTDVFANAKKRTGTIQSEE